MGKIYVKIYWATGFSTSRKKSSPPPTLVRKTPFPPKKKQKKQEKNNIPSLPPFHIVKKCISLPFFIEISIFQYKKSQPSNFSPHFRVLKRSCPSKPRSKKRTWPCSPSGCPVHVPVTIFSFGALFGNNQFCTPAKWQVYIWQGCKIGATCCYCLIVLQLLK